MVVTELGMVRLVRPVQPVNECSPIVVTEPRMVVRWQPEINLLVAVSIIALQPSRES